MAQVGNERWDGCVQPHFPCQVCHQRLQPLAGTMPKVIDLLGKKGNNLSLVLMRLSSESLNEPESVAQIDVLKGVLVFVCLAEVLQFLPAPFRLPSEHFEPFAESLFVQ